MQMWEHCGLELTQLYNYLHTTNYICIECLRNGRGFADYNSNSTATINAAHEHLPTSNEYDHSSNILLQYYRAHFTRAKTG